MKTNNWIGKALLLGTVFFITAWLVKPIGVSTQFSVISGIIHSTLNPKVIIADEQRETGYRSTNAYYDRNDGKIAQHIKEPLNYDLIFVLAIPLGSYVGYMLFHKKRIDEVNGTNKQCCETERRTSLIKRYLPSFLGGAILLYGARMADGCTSGHMMSGMMQSSVSGYLFAGAVFVVAIPTAIVTARRKETGGR